MSLPDVLSASRRENPLTFWLRNILGAAALCLAALTVIGLVNGPTPAFDELAEISGTYLRVDTREDDDSLYLCVQNASGVTERFILSSILHLDAGELTRRLTPGERVTVRYQDDEYRNVYEFSDADGPILSYAQAEKADRENRYWGYGLTAALAAAALGLLAVWTLRERRRRSRRAEEETLRQKQRAAESAGLAAQKPVVYTPEERTAVEEYIRSAFGPAARVFHELPMHDIQVDVAAVEPTERENFWRLVTIGMGARRMNVPPELAERNRAYAELAIFLPPEWNLLSSEESDTWPFFWLKRIARMPIANCDWVGQGFLFPTETPLDAKGQFTALLLAAASVREGNGDRLLMPAGNVVNFYQLYPLRREETEYVRVRGVWHLWQHMMRAGVTPVVDLCRDSCCDPETWFDEDIAPLCWSEAEGECFLGMEAGAFSESFFAAAGFSGSGLEWERLARVFLKRDWPDTPDFMSFASDEDTFFVSSRDCGLLRRFALMFRDLCESPEHIRALLDDAGREERSSR